MKTKLTTCLAVLAIYSLTVLNVGAQALDWEFSSAGGWGGVGWAENSTAQIVGGQLVVSGTGTNTYIRAANFNATVDVGTYPYLALKVTHIPTTVSGGATDWAVQAYFNIGGSNVDFQYLSQANTTLLGANVYVLQWYPKTGLYGNSGITIPGVGTLTGGMYVDFGTRASGEYAGIDWIRSIKSLSDIDVTAPSVPSNFTITGVTDTRAFLSWSASTDNISTTGYNIYLNGNLVNYTSATTYTITGLAPETAYSFAVQASDAENNLSGLSATAQASTTVSPDVQAPTTPANFTVTGVAGVSIGFSWAASTDNVAVYAYDLYQDGTKVGSTATATYTVSGLASATTYAFKILARDEAGNQSAFSNEIQVTTNDITVPSTPQNVTFTGSTGSTVTLSWMASSDNVSVAGYNVYQDGAQLNTSLVVATTYTAPVPVVNSDYTVKAVDAAGNISPASTPVTWYVTPMGYLDWEFNSTATGWLTVDWAENSPLSQADGQLVIGRGSDGRIRAFTNNANVDIAAYPYLAIKVNNLPLTQNSADSWAVQAYFTVNGSYKDWRYESASDLTKFGDKVYYLKWYPKTSIYGTGVGMPSTGTLTGGVYLDFMVCQTGEVAKVDWVRSFASVEDIENIDAEAPLAPANLILSTIDGTTLSLSWDAAIDNVDVTGYNVYFNGVKINSNLVTATSYTTSVPGGSGSFTVKALDAEGNISEASNAANWGTTAVSNGEISVTQLTLFPNPTTGKITLNLQNDLKGAVSVQVFNFNGTLQKSISGHKYAGLYSQEIDLSTLSKGLYLVRLQLNGKAVSKAVVVE